MGKWINSKIKKPPKNEKILGIIDFCGKKRINVVYYSLNKKEWRTDMQLNTINEPSFWQKLPKMKY